MKKNKISSNKSFGIVFCIFFSILAIYPYIIGFELNLFFLILGIIFLLLGLLNSKLLYPLNFLWYKLGIYLGKLTSPFLMFFIYFLIVCPTKFFLFFFKKDTLNLKINKEKSYWNYIKNRIINMDNQF